MLNIERKISSVARMGSCLSLVMMAAAAVTGCSHAQKSSEPPAAVKNLPPLKVEGPQALQLKADGKRSEKVAYFHSSFSKSYEENEVRHQKEETLEFTSQAETVSVDEKNGRFTQMITVLSKDGNADLHDFAMPELGEKLEVVADSRGRILKAGEYPDNSIFFVPPISLPENPVEIGDTWTMQASWLSLGEMVPYQLDMVTILKGYGQCGTHRCANLEISGEVSLQGQAAQVLNFKSTWRGHTIFDMDAGTVLWSRVDSEERLLANNVRRDVESCLEALLLEPVDIKLANIAKPACKIPRKPSSAAHRA